MTVTLKTNIKSIKYEKRTNRLELLLLGGIHLYCITKYKKYYRRQIPGLQRQISSCEQENFSENFVAATYRTNSNWFDFVRPIAATKSVCDCISDFVREVVHTRRFVVATYRRNELM
jgi:hypothetical protein